MHVQLALVRGSKRQRFIIRKSETIVGRQKGCDLRIPLSEISRRHCVLRLQDGTVTLEDLDSANGTYLNEDRVQGSVAVQSGDQIRLGPIVFVAEFKAQSPNDHADVERIEPAKSAVDEDIEEDGDGVDDGMPQSAQPIDEVKQEDVSQPIPVDSSESLPATDDETTRPPPKKRRPAKKPEEQQPMPDPFGTAENVMKDWSMPADNDFGALLDGIVESEQERKAEEQE